MVPSAWRGHRKKPSCLGTRESKTRGGFRKQGYPFGVTGFYDFFWGGGVYLRVPPLWGNTHAFRAFRETFETPPQDFEAPPPLRGGQLLAPSMLKVGQSSMFLKTWVTCVLSSWRRRLALGFYRALLGGGAFFGGCRGARLSRFRSRHGPREGAGFRRLEDSWCKSHFRAARIYRPPSSLPPFFPAWQPKTPKRYKRSSSLISELLDGNIQKLPELWLDLLLQHLAHLHGLLFMGFQKGLLGNDVAAAPRGNAPAEFSPSGSAVL